MTVTQANTTLIYSAKTSSPTKITTNSTNNITNNTNYHIQSAIVQIAHSCFHSTSSRYAQIGDNNTHYF